MNQIVEVVLTNLLAYLINLASNERSTAIGETRRKKFENSLANTTRIEEAIKSSGSIRDEVRRACIELARNRSQIELSDRELPIWRLLTDDVFQSDLTDWLMAGGIVEGEEARSRLLRTMEVALNNSGASPSEISFLQTNYFDAIEKSVYTHPVLAQWRHQLSIEYLRERVSILAQRANEAAGIFSTERQNAALDRYCEKALTAWDIIDLSNLPEGDIHMATQKLLLRQLYVPLRIEVEPIQLGERNDLALIRMEQEREARRHREAGHIVGDVLEGLRNRASIGDRLAIWPRLVVLGDPGGGKTTMLRWIATAFLLRYQGDAAVLKVPDNNTLPDKRWIPVLIRCRDLSESDLCRSFIEFLAQHLNKTELLPDEADVMQAVILDRIAKGEVLLLVDGLDEISNMRVRTMFCQELERTAARYPDAPIVVTSRIVGYRDMPHRMSAGFEHGQIAELNHEDKDVFAHRWIEVTEQNQTAIEKAARSKELLDAFHSSERIERLTGNPMMLTTLALVKRKVGKLPSKRTKLYAEAVSVLLNWNPKLYEAIEEDEAIPQLEYLAYEMCRRGVQQLTYDDILEVLDQLRTEYPNIRAIQRRSADAFLEHLEERSSILIKAGGIWETNSNKSKAVWEFRHLTFQEYLAARAILDGRFPNRDKQKRLAEHVAPLAGRVETSARFRSRRLKREAGEVEVQESWREALRLLVADCKDDDVDEALTAILKPTAGEEVTKTSRARTVLAALCLADEPNVSERMASEILTQFVDHVGALDGAGGSRTSLFDAGVELGRSIWEEKLKQRLIEAFLQPPMEDGIRFGGLWAKIEAQFAIEAEEPRKSWIKKIVERLRGANEIERVSAALVVMERSYLNFGVCARDLIDGLFSLITRSTCERYAAIWALGRLSVDIPIGKSGGYDPLWIPQEEEIDKLLDILRNIDWQETHALRWLLIIIANYGDTQMSNEVYRFLNHQTAFIRTAAVNALGRLGDKRIVPDILVMLGDEDAHVRRTVARTIGYLADNQAIGVLFARLNDQDRNVRNAVLEAIETIARTYSIATLLENLESQNSNVRIAVVKMLGRLGNKSAIGPLIAKLEDQDARIRVAAVVALGQLGDKGAAKSLIEKLNQPTKSFRRAVIESLVRLGDRNAIPALNMLLTDSDDAIAWKAADAVEALGEPVSREFRLNFRSSRQGNVRRLLVGWYAKDKGAVDGRLLSLDFTSNRHWRDPISLITLEQVVNAANKLGLSIEVIRSRFELMGADLKLKLAWKSA